MKTKKVSVYVLETAEDRNRFYETTQMCSEFSFQPIEFNPSMIISGDEGRVVQGLRYNNSKTNKTVIVAFPGTVLEAMLAEEFK